VLNIKDTISIYRISVSQAYEKEIAENSGLKLLGDWKELELDGKGDSINSFQIFFVEPHQYSNFLSIVF
jgi:hypothetical protein